MFVSIFVVFFLSMFRVGKKVPKSKSRGWAYFITFKGPFCKRMDVFLRTSWYILLKFPPQPSSHVDHIYLSGACHSLMHIPLFTWHNASYAKEPHLNFSTCRCVANDSLRFLRSLFLKAMFAACRIPDWQFFFSRYLTGAFGITVSGEESSVILMFVFLYVICLFPLAVIKVLYFSLVLKTS